MSNDVNFYKTYYMFGVHALLKFKLSFHVFGHITLQNIGVSNMSVLN